MELVGLFIILTGLMWLAAQTHDPQVRRCPDCGMPGASLMGGHHWPDCPRGKSPR